MRFLTTLVFLAISSTLPCFGQVTVLGKFLVGDTSKLHLLKTENDHQFIGTVTAWTSDSVLFQTTSGIDISFSAYAIQSIEVTEETANLTTQISTVFVLETIDGKRYYGHPESIAKYRIIFNAGSAGTLRLKPEDVRSITQESALFFDRNSFENDYLLKNNKGKRSLGELRSYQDGHIYHMDQRGNETRYSVKALKKFELKKSRLPVLGHSRSLMFMPTGFGMNKSEREYRNVALGLNFFAIGLSKHSSIGTGFISFLPYGDYKFAVSLSDKLHWSIGGYTVIPLAYGFHTSLSIGTPDYFLNLGFLKNKEFNALDSESDFENVSLGTSVRIGNRTRLVAEYNIITTSVSEFGSNYDLFYEKGFFNAFTWCYGYFTKRFRVEAGFIGMGPIETFCFPSDCPDIYLPIPVFSIGVKI